MLSTSLFLIVLFSLLPVLGARSKRFNEKCPKHYKRIKVFWNEYFSLYIEDHNGTTTGSVPISLANSLKYCCKKLTYSLEKLQSDEKDSIVVEEGVDYLENDTITLLFPVLASKGATKALHLFHFLPLKNSPGPMVLARKDSLTIPNLDAMSFVNLVQNPLFILSIAMTAGAAAIFWLLEFHSKEKSASPLNKLFHEIGQSVWFSVVTMTTVGYGDLVPRFLLARFFAVLWMFTATLLLSFLTAHVSSTFTTQNINENKNLIGRKLGVMHGTSLFFANDINFGAMMEEYKEKEIFSALMQGNVSRIILPDFLEAMHLLTRKYDAYSKDIVIIDTIKHPFAIGFAVMNIEEIDTSFLNCLKLALQWSYVKEAEKYFTTIDLHEVAEWSLNDLSNNMLWRTSIYIFVSSLILIVLGGIKMLCEQKI